MCQLNTTQMLLSAKTQSLSPKLNIFGLRPHHIETPVPVRSSKLSNIERDQYLDG